MKRIIGILCGLFFFLFSFAQETFQKETYISSRGDTLLYRLLRPEVMKPDEKYPLVLFLHGAGERGNDNEKQLVHGGQMWLNPVNREKYPAFILAPQCPETGYWAYTERPQHHWLSTYMQKTTWHSPHPWEDDDCDHEMGNQSSD